MDENTKNEVRARRNTWVACSKCGHKVAKVRTCDMEIKCKHCGHEFEAIIISAKSVKDEVSTQQKQ